MSTTVPTLPFLVAEVECVRVDRLSPSFVRVELASPALADFGGDGPMYDQRIKLVLPDGDAPLPSIESAVETWATWLERPVPERGHLRTYTVRDVRGEGVDTRVVVDVVVHEGDCGPGGCVGCACPGR